MVDPEAVGVAAAGAGGEPTPPGPLSLAGEGERRVALVQSYFTPSFANASGGQPVHSMTNVLP